MNDLQTRLAAGDLSFVDEVALAEAIGQIQPRKSPSGYLHAVAGLYPARRLIRRHVLDLKRVREPDYFREVCTQQFRIEQERYALALIDAAGLHDHAARPP